VLRLKLARGRFLDASDGAGAPKTALVNQTLAAREFAGRDPIGRRVRLGRGDAELWTIVGVVADVKNFETIDPPDPEAYVSFAQRPRRGMTLVLRSSEKPETLSAAARAAVAAVDPTEPIASIATMDERILRVTNPFVTIAAFVTFFGAVTLLLAAVGVYGVVSYGFAQRTREIGIRMALGAGRADVASLVLRQLRTFLLAGVLPGMLLAYALGHALRAMLFGVTPSDWRMYLSMTLLLSLVALVAALVPARRAMTIDPVTALRQD
jgi:ABC-type antimicrobial peptide transport system permease subunit